MIALWLLVAVSPSLASSCQPMGFKLKRKLDVVKHQPSFFFILKKVQRPELGIFKTQRQKTPSASTTKLSSLWAPVRFVHTFSAICPPKVQLLAVDTAKYSFKGPVWLILADLCIVDWTFVVMFPCVNPKTATEVENCTFNGNIAKEMLEQTLS